MTPIHIINREKIKGWYKRHSSFINIIALALFLYLFIFSLELMGSSLKMFGREFAKSLIQTTSNPIVGLFIGILSTSIIQSSSSTTSIVVGMVAGGALGTSSAIPIIMGANIGTSVTNTLASLPQINRSSEFSRAFSAATVHDFFNVLAVLVLFPIQIMTDFLGKTATFLGEALQHIGGLTFLSPVKALTSPLVKFLIKHTGIYPWILFVASLLLLLFSLKGMVGALKALVVEKAEMWFDTILFKTSLRAFLIGLMLTVIVQSSSITTSLMVPMAGAGVLALEQIFPYTVGANIGTTITAILAALVTGNLGAIVVAFSHLVFNISGMIIWWPLKGVPIFFARTFSQYSVRSKIIPIGYILIVFLIVPLLGIYLLR